MLVLSRKLNQEITIGDNVTITVLKVKGNTVRLGIDAPRHIRVVRGELQQETEEQTAEVTVVFNNPSQSAETDSLDVLQFQTPKKQEGSIRYRARMPKALAHNRLKSIVAEMGKSNG